MNPEIKLKWIQDPEDLNKVIQNAKKYFDIVQGLQEKAEEKGTLTSFESKKYEEAKRKLNELYRLEEQHFKSLEKNKSDIRERFQKEAERKVAAQMKKQGISEMPHMEYRQQVQSMQDTLMAEFYKVGAVSEDMLKNRSLINKTKLTNYEKVAPPPTPASMKDQIRQAGQAAGQIGGNLGIPGAGMFGKIGMGQAGAIGAIGMIAAGMFGAAEETKNLLVSINRELLIPMGKITRAQENKYLGMVREGKLPALMSGKDYISAYSGLYQGGMGANQIGEKDIISMRNMSLLGYGPYQQIGQQIGSLSYYSGRKDTNTMAQEIMSLREKSGNINPAMIMQAVMGATQQVFSTTGQAVDQQSVMGILQSMADTGLMQGKGVGALQSFGKLNQSMYGGEARNMLLRGFGQSGMSYVEAMKQADLGMSDPKNIAMLQQMIKKMGGGSEDMEFLIKRKYLGFDPGTTDLLGKMKPGKKGEASLFPQETINDMIGGFKDTRTGGVKEAEIFAEKASILTGEGLDKAIEAVKRFGNSSQIIEKTAGSIERLGSEANQAADKMKEMSGITPPSMAMPGITLGYMISKMITGEGKGAM